MKILQDLLPDDMIFLEKTLLYLFPQYQWLAPQSCGVREGVRKKSGFFLGLCGWMHYRPIIWLLMDIVGEEMDMITTRDGHADAAMSDSCRLMRICDHVKCVSAEKSDGAMKKKNHPQKSPVLTRISPFLFPNLPNLHGEKWGFCLLFDAAHSDMRRFMSPW